MSEQAVDDEGSEIPPGLNGLSSIDARRTALSDARRVARIRRAAIFARISPEQKFPIVDGLKGAGAIAANDR